MHPRETSPIHSHENGLNPKEQRIFILHVAKRFRFKLVMLLLHVQGKRME